VHFIGFIIRIKPTPDLSCVTPCPAIQVLLLPSPLLILTKTFCTINTMSVP